MWFYRKAKEEALKPGICECEHTRCSHENGTGPCTVQYAPHTEDNEWDVWAVCACRVFILDKDGGGGSDHPEVPVDPEVAELERIARMK
jgi:hypothetical protein